MNTQPFGSTIKNNSGNNSKLLFTIHSNIKNRSGNDSKLLFTSTDSLMYEIKKENLYEDFSMDKVMFYFSNYSQLDQMVECSFMN